MADAAAGPQGLTPRQQASRDVQTLVRCALTASLATFDRSTGHPYVSLVTVATAPDGAPVLLLSKLARHTRNLMADGRASLLFDGTQGTADPLAGGRATLLGRIAPTVDPTDRRRFIARHEASAVYADFQDFAFYKLVPGHAHFIGGFGRIVELDASEFLIDVRSSAPLIEAEPEIVAHMNRDHAEAVALYATALLGEQPGCWRMTGIDPAGADLLDGRCARRLNFENMLATAGDARRALADLAGAARGASPRR